MLDSSPVTLPPNRKSLKRSASTASLASMPTPPRTHRRHARGLSRGSCDSDSDDHAVLSSDDDLPDAHKSKKQRTNDAPAADEDAFWLGGSSADAVADGAGPSRVLRSAAPPLLYRKKPAAQASEVAPVSPPPSNRRPVAQAKSVAPTSLGAFSSPPRTPRTRSATKRALRDSPTNPFLDTPEKPVKEAASPSPSATDENPSPHTPDNGEERPFIVYVFRGQRRVYQNPLFNHAKNRPYSPPPASQLPVEHPDYSPPIHCPPKLLFPEAHRKTRGKKVASAPKTSQRARSPSLSGDELDLEDLRPKKLDFGKPAVSKAQNEQKAIKKVVEKKPMAVKRELRSAKNSALSPF